MANLIKGETIEKLKNQQFTFLFFENGKRVLTLGGSMVHGMTMVMERQHNSKSIQQFLIFTKEEILRQGIKDTNNDIEYYQQFLSYSSPDNQFAQTLYYQ